MSNGIQALGSLQGAEPVAQASTRANAPSVAGLASAEPAAAPGPFIPNPSLHIDPGLGIVIIEFHDTAGKVSSTIPTERLLDAYRRSFSGNADTTTPLVTGTSGITVTPGQAAAAPAAGAALPSAGKPVIA